MMFQPVGDILDTTQLDLQGDFATQVDLLLQRVRLSRTQVNGLITLFDDLENTLHGRWPGCKVYPFGSIVTGLGIQTSDVDCFICLPHHFRVNLKTKGRHDPIVHIAKSVLSTRNDLFTELFAIPMTKVPIVKFFHIPTQRHCDVNFKSPSGVENTKLIAYLLNLDRRALDLAIIVKYWSKVHNLTGTNLMSNYALTMLVIFFLQQKSALPSVAQLQRFVQPYMIDKWNTSFDEGNSFQFVLNQEDSLYDLLGRFFDFYAQFDFENWIISPYMGCPVSKEVFKDISKLPEDFELYKYNLANKDCMPLKLDTTMCIQDPFEHSRNCAMAVFPKLAQKFHILFDHAAKMFKMALKEHFLKEILQRLPGLEQVVAPPTNQQSNRVQKPKNQPYSSAARKKLRNTIMKVFQQYTSSPVPPHTQSGAGGPDQVSKEPESSFSTTNQGQLDQVGRILQDREEKIRRLRASQLDSSGMSKAEESLNSHHPSSSSSLYNLLCGSTSLTPHLPSHTPSTTVPTLSPVPHATPTGAGVALGGADTAPGERVSPGQGRKAFKSGAQKRRYNKFVKMGKSHEEAKALCQIPLAISLGQASQNPDMPAMPGTSGSSKRIREQSSTESQSKEPPKKTIRRGDDAGPSFRDAVASTRLGLIDDSRPFSASDRHIFEEALDRVINATTEDVRFLGCAFRAGMAILTCNDVATSEWLRSHYQEIVPWQGASLRLVEPDNIPKRTYATMCVPDPLVVPDSMLATLRRQNPAVVDDSWRVERSEQGPAGVLMIVSFCGSRLAALNAAQGRLWFRSRFLQVTSKKVGGSAGGERNERGGGANTRLQRNERPDSSSRPTEAVQPVVSAGGSVAAGGPATEGGVPRTTTETGSGAGTRSFNSQPQAKQGQSIAGVRRGGAAGWALFAARGRGSHGASAFVRGDRREADGDVQRAGSSGGRGAYRGSRGGQGSGRGHRPVQLPSLTQEHSSRKAARKLQLFHLPTHPK